MNESNPYQSPEEAFRSGPLPKDGESVGDSAGMRLVLPVGRTPLSIVAGYLGLLSPLLVPAPFALGLGIWATVDIVKNPGKRGLGRAIFGIVGGLVGCALLVLVVIAVLTKNS